MLATCGICGGLAASLCGLAICFGASIVTLGSRACDVAVPLRPHNNAVARIATAECVIRHDDTLITRSPKCRPRFGLRYLFLFSAVTRNFPPFSMPLQYHQDRW